MRPLVLVVLSILVLTGCSTARQERAQNTATSMTSLRSLLARGSEQTSALQEAITQLTLTKPDGLRKSYDQFARKAAELRGTADEARDVGAAMKKRAKAYFANWEKEMSQISNSDLKALSKERQALLSQEFAAISAAMSDLGLAYTAYERDLSDMERFLGNDLTRVGSNLAVPHLDRLAKESGSVKAAIERTSAAVRHLETTLSPK